MFIFYSTKRSWCSKVALVKRFSKSNEDINNVFRHSIAENVRTYHIGILGLTYMYPDSQTIIYDNI